jgi:hypothetical protein
MRITKIHVMSRAHISALLEPNVKARKEINATPVTP